MTFHQRISTAEATPADVLGARFGGPLKSLRSKIATWIAVCADYYAAAGIYEQLSALSDAELARRGLSRATLAHDVCEACDRSVLNL